MSEEIYYLDCKNVHDLSTHYFTFAYQMGVTPRSRRTSSGIPRSTGPSRETSPNRYSGGYGQRRIGTGRSGITPDRPPKRPQMTEKILKQSLEAETAIADALVRLWQYQNYYNN